MREKERPKEINEGSGDGDPIFNIPPPPEDKNVSVSSGPYLENLPVAGMKISEVRRRYKDRFDIDEGAQAVINGNDAKEDYVLKAGEALLFVRHAGEKGADARPPITIDDSTVTATSPEGWVRTMQVEELVKRIMPGIDTGPIILPNGVKAMFSRGPFTIMIWEQAPRIQKLMWIAADSPTPYGPGTKYRPVRIGLPYVVISAVFCYQQGMPVLMRADECFFRTEPLKKLSDKLFYPGLLNCSKFTPQSPNQPLSWICTQYLKALSVRTREIGPWYSAGFEAVRACLLDTAFNLSSEHHEGNSWYSASKEIDKRIGTIERWESETQKDPLFVLDVPWINTDHSLGQFVERTFKRIGATDLAVKTAADVARLVNQG